MQGLILAAGMGKRLKDLTQNNTKCMVKVNGIALVDRVLHQLDKFQLSRIVIVVGYEGKKLIDFISTLNIKTPICFVENPIYDKTNNIYSLALAKEYLLKEDTILLESDLIFEDNVLRILLDDPRETLALVDKYESWMDGTCIKIGENDSIEAFVPGKKFVFEDIPKYYKTVNIYKFSRHFSETHYVPFLEAYLKALGNNEYYEQVLCVITMLDEPEIKAKKLEGQLWYEIDDIQDLDIASSMFASNTDNKVTNIQERHGGYWRYPYLLDFCYPINPYYPPKKLMDEMKVNFETLLTRNPSGMEINSLLAAKNFGIYQEHVLVGNGASELIKCLMKRITGKIGFIHPASEAYLNRYNEANSIVYIPRGENLVYDTNDLKKYFDGKSIENLVLINPDNSSGNYIVKKELLCLIEWCEERNIKIIVDESFVDFTEEKDSTLIDEEIINDHKNLIIIKSISKSHGVPGVRLGILVSSDAELIADIKKEFAIWNINSFGEFYMQIEEKYKKHYVIALKELQTVREQFIKELSAISGLCVIPSQANYLLIEITNGMTAKELTKVLFLKYNLFVKDLSKEIQMNGRQFIRIAIRNSEDNTILIKALENVMG